MKKIRILLPLLVLMVFFLPACQPDEQDPAPTDSRDKFVGSWKVNEVSRQTGSNPAFLVDISLSSTNASQIVIANFYNLGFQFQAYADVNSNSLTLPLQVISGSTVKGSGTYDGPTKLTMNYIVDNDTITSAIFTKQ